MVTEKKPGHVNYGKPTACKLLSTGPVPRHATCIVERLWCWGGR